MTTLSRRRLTAFLPAFALMAPTLGRAQELSRPLRLIVPWPPGGGVDALGRVLQASLGNHLGRLVVIENVGGGSGRVGTQAASRAAPDGHTFLLANDTFAATEALAIAGTASLRAALDPVTLAISAPQGVFTHPRSGLKTIADYAAVARAKPGALNVGVPGLGSSQHLTSELLLRAAGDLRVTHVPYRGGGPLLQDLVAGNIDAGVVTFAAAAQQASGAEARSSSTRKAAGAVPVRRATCAAASAMPPPNQAPYEGNHIVCSAPSSQPAPIMATHARVSSAPEEASSTVRTGRQVRPTASTASSGRSR